MCNPVHNPKPTTVPQPPGNSSGGLPVRTALRAGLACDDLDNQTQELWNKFTNALTNVANSVTGNSNQSA